MKFFPFSMQHSWYSSLTHTITSTNIMYMPGQHTDYYHILQGTDRHSVLLSNIMFENYQMKYFINFIGLLAI